MRYAVVIGVLGLGLAGVDARAEQHVDVFPYYIVPDSDRGTDDRGVGGRLIYGWGLTDRWFLEAQGFGSVIETDNPGATDFYLYGAGADLVYDFRGRKGFSPFILIGVGGDFNDVQPDDLDGSSAFANLGLGFVTPEFNDGGIRLRADVRYFHDFFQDDYGDWHFGLGLSVPLGRIQERVVEHTIVKEVVVEKPVAPPTDLDQDGVPDRGDSCPNTIPHARVDVQGCMLQTQTITLQGVNFEFNKADLTGNAKLILQSVSRALLDQPGLNFEIAGHTDSVGSDTYNLNLSRARAEAVRSYLVSVGIASNRAVARGYGESEPVASNDTEAGRAQNRRVELRVLGAQ